MRTQTHPPHEILVLDDGSDEVVVADCLTDYPDVRVLRNDPARGVATARNRLLEEATGDVCFLLDDDAFLADEGGLERLAAAVEQHPRSGVFATRIVERTSSGDVPLLPFSVGSRRKEQSLGDHPRLVSYFLGGGHAIRRKVYEEIGGYDETFVWGEEELDLSYRVIAAGYEVLYLPDVIVVHQEMPSVLGAGNRRELYLRVRNRILLARKHLPARYVVPYLSIWMSRFAGVAIAGGMVGEFLRGAVGGIRMLRQTPRAPLGRAAVSYLKQNYGRLWF